RRDGARRQHRRRRRSARTGRQADHRVARAPPRGPRVRRLPLRRRRVRAGLGLRLRLPPPGASATGPGRGQGLRPSPALGARVTLYSVKVKVLKTHRGNAVWRRWRMLRGDEIGDYGRLPDLVRAYAAGRTFADIGCMWGVNGEYSFVAEEAGATAVTGVDVFGPTPEFEEKRRARGSSVRFVLGDATSAETIEQIGVADVVLCAGVLYHHPSPFDVLTALRRICGQTLILRTASIPEIPGLPNGAVYYPLLTDRQRRLWNLSSLGLG